MYTRTQYLAREVSHWDYYGQFVTKAIREWVINYIGKDALTRAIEQQDTDHFHSIPLSEWDRLTPFLRFSVEQSLKEAGDFWSLAEGVCILKCAARQLCLEHLSGSGEGKDLL